MYSASKWEPDDGIIIIQSEKNSLIMQQDFYAILNL